MGQTRDWEDTPPFQHPPEQLVQLWSTQSHGRHPLLPSHSLLCRTPNTSTPCTVPVPEPPPLLLCPQAPDWLLGYKPVVPPSCHLQGIGPFRQVHPLSGGLLSLLNPGSFHPALGSPRVPWALTGHGEQHLPSLHGRNFHMLMPERFQQFEST